MLPIRDPRRRWQAIVLIAALAVGGCGAEGTCATNADCGDLQFCANLTMIATASCDYDVLVHHACDDKAPCPGDQVCDPVALGCHQFERHCVARCASSIECPVGDRCQQGRCEAEPCGPGGFVCTGGAACVAPPDPLEDNPFDGDRRHGCQFQACASADDCRGPGSWRCVNEVCQTVAGACVYGGG